MATNFASGRCRKQSRRDTKPPPTRSRPAPAAPATQSQRSPGRSRRISTNIDEALELLRGYGPEFGDLHLSNHGPMAAEVLIVLGREDAVLPWVESYARRLGDDIPLTAAIDPDGWAAALGDHSRTRDWVQFFARELEAAPHGELLGRWIPRLAPGLRAIAAHGLIRVAHATRSLDAEVNPLRLEELARGLGYWAGYYETLPTVAPSASPSMEPESTVDAALARVHRVPVRERRGSINGLMREVGEHPSFPNVINLLAPPPTPTPSSPL